MYICCLSSLVITACHQNASIMDGNKSLTSSNRLVFLLLSRLPDNVLFSCGSRVPTSSSRPNDRGDTPLPMTSSHSLTRRRTDTVATRYHTTIALRQSPVISRIITRFILFIRGKTPLRMRVDGFAYGGTRISHHERANRAIMYITLHTRQKQRPNAIAHACGRFLQMVGHIYQPTIVLRRTTFILGIENANTNAIAHACGRVCRWWDTYITPPSCFVLHVFVSFPRKPLFVCLTFRETYSTCIY